MVDWGGFLIRSDIFIIIDVSLLTAAAGCQGSGIFLGRAPDTPLNVSIVNLVCPAYSSPKRNIADTSNFDVADKK